MAIRTGLEENPGSGRSVDVGHGLTASERIRGVFDSADLTFLVELSAVYSGERYEVAALQVRQREGGPAVTTEGLRQIPVTEMLTAAAIGHVWDKNQHLFDSKPIRPQIGDDESLLYVAKLYRAATVTQEDPARAVMLNLKLPRATAGRWIRRARDRGFLSDAAPHRPKGSK